MTGVTLASNQLAVTRETPESIPAGRVLPTATHLVSGIQACIEAFWNLSPRMRVFSVGDQPHYYWHMQDFYVAQKGLDKDGTRWAQLRLSEGLCQTLFETTLGKAVNEPAFSMGRIRNFEVFLLERFSRKLFQVISPVLLKQPGKKAPSPEHDPMMHLVWVLDSEPEVSSQLVLTVPQSCLKTDTEGLALPSPRRWVLDDSVFLPCKGDVSVRLGITRARLDELQQLEPGDIILLEQSLLRYCQIRDPVGGGWLTVPLRLPERWTLLNTLSQQGTMTMPNETQQKQNIWDNLQVEVTAAFDPIKLPLKQIKEIEQGLVLEIGDLMDNRVKIEVEGHPVAWGELLVLGDKFGVRIQGLSEVAATESSAAMPMALSTPAPETQEIAVNEVANEDAGSDNFDLDLDDSDFDDLDDEEDWT